MDDDMQRRFVSGMINLLLGLAAAWLATYITNKILGDPKLQKKLEM
jgi:hypothetical protein